MFSLFSFRLIRPKGVFLIGLQNSWDYKCTGSYKCMYDYSSLNLLNAQMKVKLKGQSMKLKGSRPIEVPYFDERSKFYFTSSNSKTRPGAVFKCHTCIACMNVFHDNWIQFSISYWLLLSDRNLQIFANFDQQIAWIYSEFLPMCDKKWFASGIFCWTIFFRLRVALSRI